MLRNKKEKRENKGKKNYQVSVNIEYLKHETTSNKIQDHYHLPQNILYWPNSHKPQ